MKGRDVLLFGILCAMLWFGGQVLRGASDGQIIITDNMVILLAGIATIIAAVRDTPEKDHG